jgi:DNA mismatch repair protein MutL
MPKVQVLPEVLAHQIAAGEIVERPASVVKELVENSLDAGATRIRVQIEGAGSRLIRVADDGCGMSEADACLAFEHHATSKISSLEDLEAIRTLGFRGEALPSIASVSRVCLKTVEPPAETGPPTSGTELRYEGGRRISLQAIAWPQGTEISVEDLFFNTPARRKFLKSAATEISHITRLVTSYALAYPGVSFLLEHEGRLLLDAPAVSDPADRTFQVLGDPVMSNLARVDYENAGVRVHGFTSLPHEQRNSANWLFLFVNRRLVRDRLLTHAIRQAYRDLIPVQAHPVVVLFVETDPRLVDVNVHPTKTEIRFRRSQDVHVSVFRAIEQALLRHRSNLSSLARDLDLPLPGSREQRIRHGIDAFLRQTASAPIFESLSRAVPPSDAGVVSAPESLSRRAAAAPADPHGPAIPETSHLSAIPCVLGQFVESFIVVADRDGVMLVDQHVAHERILYDRALQALNAQSGVPVQGLLIPRTIRLDPQQKAAAESVLEHLNRNGFEVEWFGSDTLIVRGVPALAQEVDPAAVLEQLFRELDALDELASPHLQPDRSLRRVREKIAISLSCRAAIKINTPLTREKMQWLIDELFRCENPYTCPHGRPILLRLPLGEILRGFHRI